MSKSSKEKKLKRKQKIETEVKEENISFDVIDILTSNRMDSKPNLGKLLQQYVSTIRVFNSNKISMYPVFEYDIGKVFVKFLDGRHELIWDRNANKSPGFETPEFFLYDKCDELELKKKEDIEVIREFFNRLVEFKFVY